MNVALDRLRRAAVCAVACLALGAPAVQAKDEVSVAFIGPLTGGVSAIGIGARNSASLAVALRNQDPKAKYTYSLVAMDDECKPNVGIQVATKAATDKKIIGAVAHYCSAVAMGTVNVFHEFGLPAIVWGAVLPEITSGNDFDEIFRVNGTMLSQEFTASKFMTQQGFKTWAVIHDTTDYGKGHNKYFTKFITDAGGRILGAFGVSSDQQDFTAELTQIKALNPDVIYFAGLAPLGIRIRSQMDKLGLGEIQFEGASGIVSDTFATTLGPLGEGSLAFHAGVPIAKLPGGRFFMAEYEKAGFKEPPEIWGPFSFAAMNLLLDTIEKVGPNRKAVVKELMAVKDAASIVGPITFDKDGQNELALITTYIVQDGKWIPWEQSEYAAGQRKLKKRQ
jgi:branched-chain amino acid transport system substrate-binding protein